MRQLFVSLAVAAMALRAVAADTESLRTDVFVSGQHGFHTFRIPALTVTPRGTLLAFCEGRKTGRGDHGDLDLVVKRSEDSGATWSELQTVYEEGGGAPITIGNPCPVVDQTTGNDDISPRRADYNA